ncbi:MAG: DEAD/DEAH box helicase [Gammaproteobacteria bacterium]
MNPNKFMQELTNNASLTEDIAIQDSNQLIPLSLSLSPAGHLYLYTDSETEALSKASAEKIISFFSINESVGLLRLGLTQFTTDLPSSLSFWQMFSRIFIAEICKLPDSDDISNIPQIILPSDEVNDLISQAPFIRGIEYLNQETALLLWQGLQTALSSELSVFDGLLSDYLSKFNSSWNTIGRVCFHLAENKTNPDYPFAFLATYATGLAKNAALQHLPLGKALEEYADINNKSTLLSLLLPVHRAKEKSVLLKSLVETGKIFKPQAWRAQEAYQFLQDIPHFEAAGVVIRVPNWWNSNKPSRPTIKVTVGEKTASQVGLDALLDFDIQFALSSGETLTAQEFKKILESTDKLVQIKGQWVQVDNEKLNQVLSHWKSIERQVKKEGLSFAEGLRILSGVSHLQSKEALPEEITQWSTVIEGDWLQSALTHLRHPQKSDESINSILKKSLNAKLRPYQERGVEWLWWLYNMRLGGCLADDMGLGKTIQVISLLLLVKQKVKTQPHLLILPASLVCNWQAEIRRFSPELSLWIAHGSMHRNDQKPNLAEIDLVMTTYGTLMRLPWISETAWDMVILDEAQAIKNPTAKQTRAIKSLTSRVRFVLTGTPIENRLLDLWSLFDFVAPGLLGSSRVFADYNKQKAKQAAENNVKGQFNAAVRRLVNPYILRRLKSDKRIISDLPDKTEMQTYCTLTKHQVGLYQQAVNELATQLESQIDDIHRRGLVMSYLLRFKQICNHPSQWLGHGQYTHELSGKFLRLKELCEIIAEKQEKVLVFTQFREIIPALTEFLSQIFKREGLCLDGQTKVKERAKRVEQFQQDQGPPFFVLSLKAGGTGLNLTAASHVIHFDRWWNPAVENQATDRAFRIGQKKNVLVHKFICRGTIEEKIDDLLNSKKSLSNEIMGQDNEVILTELSDAQLINMVTLDIHRALSEN